MSTESFPFDAFLSYTTRGDYWVGRRVEAFLESFHTSFGRQQVGFRALQICRDGSDFRQARAATGPRSDAIWAQIEQRLQESARLIVMCSPEATKASWVSREVQWMLDHRGEEAILLAVTAGPDPASKPNEVFPQPVLAHRLHEFRIWYDLRQWRGSNDPRLRDAEDELVRLALDLLAVDEKAQAPVAALWQREAVRRQRQRARWVTAGAACVLLASVVAGFQFVAAKRNAESARAASIIRTAAADTDPLRSALLFVEASPEHVPTNALALGWSLLDKHLPLANLRGHSRGLITGTFTADGRIVTVDIGGRILLWPNEGRGDPIDFSENRAGKVDAAVFADSGAFSFLAYKDGLISRVSLVDKTVRQCSPGTDTRRLVPTPDSEALLILGYTPKVFVCRFGSSSTVMWTTELKSRPVSSWVDAERKGWLVITDEGQAWLVPWSGDSARRLPTRSASGRVAAKLGIVEHADQSPDGRHLAMASRQALVLMTTGSKGARPLLLPLDQRPMMVSFSPNSTVLAVATDQGEIRRYRVPTLEALPPLDSRLKFYRYEYGRKAGGEKLEGLPVSDLAWSPDGRILASIQSGLAILLWPQDANREPSRFEGHSGAIALVWARDGRRLATLGDDGIVRIWPVPGESRATSLRLSAKVYSGAISPDGQMFAIGTHEGEIWLGDVMQRRWVGKIGYSESRSDCPDSSESLRTVRVIGFDAARGELWAALDNGIATRWKVDGKGNRLRLGVVCGLGTIFAFADSNGMLAWIDASRRLSVWTGTGVPALSVDVLPGKAGSLQFSRDGTQVAAGMDTGHVALWTGLPSITGKATVWQAHIRDVLCAVPGARNGEVLTGSMDGRALWWRSPEDSNPISFVDTQAGTWMEQCDVGLDRHTIFLSSSAGRLWMGDTRGGMKPALIGSSEGIAQIGSVLNLVASARFIATGGGVDGMLRLWTRKSGELTAEAFLESAVTVLRFSQGGEFVLAAGEGGLVRLLPLSVEATRQEIMRRTTATLTVREREKLLGEDAELARERYETSERQHGRTPLPRTWQFEMPF